MDLPNSAGRDLPDSLAMPICNEEMKGKFIYMTNSNILSYVLKEVTGGMSPKEFADANFFPALGINASDWDWDVNDEGIQNSYSQMRLTARQMAKIAQLYLQKGYSSPGNVLLSEDWVDTSLSKYIWADDVFNNEYGYLWHLYDEESFYYFPNVTQNDGITTIFDPNITNSVWCASGLLGQFACLDYGMDRVVVIQRSNTVYDYDGLGMAHLLTGAFSTNYTFTSPLTTVAPAAPLTMMKETPVVLSVSSASPRGLLSYGSSFCFLPVVAAAAALSLPIIIL